MAGWTLDYKAPIAPVNPQSAAIPAIQAAGRNNAGAAMDVASAYLRDWTDKNWNQRQRQEQTQNAYGVQTKLLQQKAALQGQVAQQKAQQEAAMAQAQASAFDNTSRWATDLLGNTGAVEQYQVSVFDAMGVNYAEGSPAMGGWLEKRGAITPEDKQKMYALYSKKTTYPVWTSPEIQGKAWSQIVNGVGMDNTAAKGIFENSLGGVYRDKNAAREQARSSVATVGRYGPTVALGTSSAGRNPADLTRQQQGANPSTKPISIVGDMGMGVLEKVFGDALPGLAREAGGKTPDNLLVSFEMSKGQLVPTADGPRFESQDPELDQILNDGLKDPSAWNAAGGIVAWPGGSNSEQRGLGSYQERPAEAAPEARDNSIFTTDGMLDFVQE